jgi:hypothetical protein
VAQGKPCRDLRDVDRLVSRSVMGVWFGILFFGAFLRVGSPHRPAFLAKADSRRRSTVLLLLQRTYLPPVIQAITKIITIPHSSPDMARGCSSRAYPDDRDSAVTLMSYKMPV